MADEGRYNSKVDWGYPQLVGLLVTVTIVLIANGFLLSYRLPDWRWEHHPFHTLIEGVGAFIALYLVGTLFSLQEDES